MIANVRLKVFLQEKLFPLFSFINKKIVHDEHMIMFYSNIGPLRDNSAPLLDYMLKKGCNKYYKIICSTKDYKKHKYDNIPNVQYVSNLMGVFYFFKVGYVFYSVGKIPILPGIKQKVSQLWHGIYFKGADEGLLKGHTLKYQYYTHFMSTSEWLKPLWRRIFSLEENRIYVTGQPRNDALFNNTHYNFGEYKKLVVWMPTFRKSKVMGYENTKSNEILPIISHKEYREFNDYLACKDIKVVIKLHPFQDISSDELVNLDHLILLSHNEFVKKNIDLYSFIGQCDAMITDYSSVFFDYLILNRPIGFTISDMTEYTENRGFNFDNPLSYMPGPHIQTKEELYKFIDNLSCGNDEYEAQRKKVNALFNDYTDNQSCRRVLNAVGIEVFE